MTDLMAKVTKCMKVEIIDYPGALQSAVYGLKEFLQLANTQALAESEFEFAVTVTRVENLIDSDSEIILLPPNLEGEYFMTPDQALLDYLRAAHQKGAVIGSVCAGAFILAQTGLLQGRTITTHWQLEDRLAASHPDLSIDINKIVIDDVDIITAGGLMSWMDLAFTLITRYANPARTRQLGKYLVVDTGAREQRYYQAFSPNYSHGNEKIAHVQRYIQTHYHHLLGIDALADQVCMTPRTFIRHFSKATGLTPIHYVQRIRVQKACELLESTVKPVEQVSYLVGYEDVNSFRKVFTKIVGLTPSAFRSRFLSEQQLL